MTQSAADPDTTDRLHILYRLFNADGDLLYIGITTNPGVRFAEHRLTKSWWGDVATTTLEHFPSRAELEQAEAQAIAREAPKRNMVRYSARSRIGDPPSGNDLPRFTREERIATGKRYANCRAAVKEDLRVLKLMARAAHREGVPETKIAKDLGVDRMTVRKWLGKR